MGDGLLGRISEDLGSSLKVGKAFLKESARGRELVGFGIEKGDRKVVGAKRLAEYTASGGDFEIGECQFWVVGVRMQERQSIVEVLLVCAGKGGCRRGTSSGGENFGLLIVEEQTMGWAEFGESLEEPCHGAIAEEYIGVV
jgi:hypothetical protein